MSLVVGPCYRTKGFRCLISETELEITKKANIPELGSQCDYLNLLQIADMFVVYTHPSPPNLRMG